MRRTNFTSAPAGCVRFHRSEDVFIELSLYEIVAVG